jgi:small nuclear ribonucleoprotein D3
MSIGVPIKLLHEAEKHIVTIELKTGEVYRGQLVEAEDNMNCQLANITYTARDGQRSTLEYAFIRGSKVRWMILPDMLKNAPMFKKVDPRSRGLGRGKIIAMKSKMRSSGRGRGDGTGGGRDWQGRGNR